VYETASSHSLWDAHSRHDHGLYDGFAESVRDGVRGMRSHLLDILSNADLAFSPGGQNMTLGALVRRMGDLEYSYIQSLKTGVRDLSYQNTEADLENDITRLKTRFQALDDELLDTISAFSKEELTRRVDRGGFPSTVEREIDHYGEALLIFFGKATIYLLAMNKPVPESIENTIG
jgi:uncharacterized damage-inducible protein DinB